ncbi:MAG TPA: DNA internalization-related competence protein ComEC/Rec2 [Nitrospiria bacterium]|nr:DNA internalization-related competence protein ComEC/Rec2 [Nitrospiria bacterium]
MPSAPLAPVALAYLGGLLLGEGARYYPVTMFFILGLTISLACLFGSKFGWSLRRLSPIILLLLVGLLVRHFSLVRSRDDVSRWCERGSVRLLGKVWGLPKHGPDRTAFRMQAMSVREPSGSKWVKASGLVRVSIRDPDLDLLPGDVLEFDTKLLVPRGYWDPGVFDFGSRLERLGIHAVAHLSRADRLIRRGRSGGSALRLVQSYRDRIRSAILMGTDGPTRAILLSMIIGEDGYLTPDLRDAFMASGTTHILSISGSHLGLVAVVVFGAVRLLVRLLPARIFLRLTLFMSPSQIASLVTLFPVIFYALLAGAETATFRSLIMIVVYLTAILIGRQGALLNSLALAVLITLIWDPAAPLDLSFQLSYLSVLAICGVTLLWQRRLAGREESFPAIRRWRERLLFSALVTLGVTLVTAPLTLYHFHQVSWVGIFANWVVVPIAGFLIVPLGLLTSFITLLWHSPILPLAGIQTVVCKLFLWIVSVFANLPGSEVHFPSPPPVLVFVLYLLPLAFFVGGRWLRWTVLSLVPIPLFVWGLFFFPSADAKLQVTFLDVGQGDSALVRFPDGETMLIDGGGGFGKFDTGRSILAPFFWQSGVHRIDYLVATHPQLDHMGGLNSVLEQFQVGEVWTNGVHREIGFARKFEAAAASRQISNHPVQRGDRPIKVGSCSVVVLNPSGGVSNEMGGHALNNDSVALRVDCPDFYSVLFTADIEDTAERDLVRSGLSLSADLLKVPHHGGKGSLEPTFLEAVSPRVAVISVGSHNPYGHPTPEALATYKELGAAVYRTDLFGAIRVEGTQKDLRVRRFSETFLQEVSFRHDMLFQEWRNYRKAFMRF